MSDSTSSLGDGLSEFITSTVNSLTEDPRESLDILEKATRDLARFAQHEDYQEARQWFEAYANFYQGLLYVQAGSFDTAAERMARAANAFKEIDLGTQADLSGALQKYYSGIIEVRRQNVSRGLELMHEGEEHLSTTGAAASEYRAIVDSLIPDQLFAAGMIAIQNQDLTKAQVLISNAAEKLETLANTYFKEKTYERFHMLGVARLYQTTLDVTKQEADFDRFDLAEAVTRHDLFPRFSHDVFRVISQNPLQNA